MSDSLQLQGLQHARPPCPSLSPGICPSLCSLNRWYHPTISCSFALFYFYLQSCPASGSFSVSRLLASGGQTIGASSSASLLPLSIQGWFPLGLYLHAMLNLHFICMSVYGLYSFPLTCLYSFHTTLIKSLTVNLYRLSTPSPPIQHHLLL